MFSKLNWKEKYSWKKQKKVEINKYVFILHIIHITNEKKIMTKNWIEWNEQTKTQCQ